MKRFVNGSIVVVVAFLVLLLVGVVAAAEESAAEPSGTAVCINFELAGHAAKPGHYSVQLPGGAEVASWYMLEGWQDSGWVDDLAIKGETELVQVLYYPGANAQPTVLKILNPTPGTEMGWMGKGMAHALQVAWPDMLLAGEVVE